MAKVRLWYIYGGADGTHDIYRTKREATEALRVVKQNELDEFNERKAKGFTNDDAVYDPNHAYSPALDYWECEGDPAYVAASAAAFFAGQGETWSNVFRRIPK